jgi:cell filamentation protein
MSDPYRDSQGVPRNLLGIDSATVLAREEYRHTEIHRQELAEKPILGNFNMEHLAAIHQYLFQDVYGWAGRERTIDFSKSLESRPGWKGVFAKHEEMREIVDNVAESLAQRGGLKGLETPEFIQAMAEIYARLNYAHPFPEGNGRALQCFLTQLAKEAGHDLDFSQVEKNQWNQAASASMKLTNSREPSLVQAADMRPILKVFEQITNSPPVQGRPGMATPERVDREQ